MLSTFYLPVLFHYLAETDEQTNQLFEILIKQTAEKQGVTKQLKSERQMEWVGRLNHIKACAEEMIRNKLKKRNY